MSAPAEALRALHQHRLARRTRDLDRFDAFYQAYITALVSGVALVMLADGIGGTRAASPRPDLAAGGVGVLALVAAVAIGAGLRSGSRGGPLVVEAAEVRHVLLSPVARRDALRTPAVRQLRFALGLAAVVGGVGGVLATHRLPGPALAWMATGAAYAITTTVLAIGAAWIAAGHRLRPAIATTVSAALVGWAAAELIGWVPLSPTHPVGAVGVAPLRLDPGAPLAVVLAAAVVGWGLAVVDGVSVERLAGRSVLVAQLRFAATMRDLRTVMLVRRQLHHEQARASSWLPAGRRSGRTVVVRRDWRALLRTPATRLLRLLALCVAAASAGVGVWLGTPALVLVAGPCSFLAGLEVLEPLAQEVDRCTVLDLAPVTKGSVLARHLIVPALVLTGVSAIAAAVVIPFTSGPATAVAVAVAVAAPLAAIAGAAVNVLREADGPGSQAIEQLMLPPEAVGMRLLYKLLLPPALSTAGFLPVFLATRAATAGTDPAQAASSTATIVALLAAAVAGWVRYHDDLRSWWANAAAEATATGSSS